MHDSHDLNLNRSCLFQALTALLADDSKFGFIVMDGNCALFGTLSGNTREVLHKFLVDLPKKHGMLSCSSQQNSHVTKCRGGGPMTCVSKVTSVLIVTYCY